jgi:glucoside 3-dehydrogenase (cytochrome c) hitch-hiker subunit
MKNKNRRESLKIIGAVGATCAYPFSADSLYGQHTHPAPGAVQIAPAGPYKSQNFSEPEFAVTARVADLIIPPTDTPGAVAAGVPRYIDEVVTANPGHKARFRAGLKWLEAAAGKSGKKFLELDEAQQIAILKPLSAAADAGRMQSDGERFFGLIKSMTADGYYTSRIGLVDELGYKGNTVLAAFPECTHPEHH